MGFIVNQLLASGVLLEMKDWKQHFINGTKGMPKVDPGILNYVEGLLKKIYEGNEEKVNNNGLAPWIVWCVGNIGLRGMNTDKLNKLRSVITLFKETGNVGNVNKYDAQNKTFAMDLDTAATYAQDKLNKLAKKKEFEKDDKPKEKNQEHQPEEIKPELSDEEKELLKQKKLQENIPLYQAEKNGDVKRVWAANDGSPRVWVKVLNHKWLNQYCDDDNEETWGIGGSCQHDNFPEGEFAHYQFIGPPKGKNGPISTIVGMAVNLKFGSIGEVKQESNVQPGSQTTSGGWNDNDVQLINFLAFSPEANYIKYFGDYYGGLDFDRARDSLYGGGVGFLWHISQKRPDLLKMLGKYRPDILENNEKIIKEIFGNEWIQIINMDINDVVKKNPNDFLRRFDVFLERFGQEAIDALNGLDLENIFKNSPQLLINKIILFTKNIPPKRLINLVNNVDLSDFVYNNKLGANEWYRALSNSVELKPFLKTILIKYKEKILSAYGTGAKAVNSLMADLEKPRLDNHQEAQKNPLTGEYEDDREVEYKDENGHKITKIETFAIPEELRILNKKDRRDFINASKDYIKSEIKSDDQGKEISFLRILFGQTNPQDVERTFKKEKEEFVSYFDKKFAQGEKKTVSIPSKSRYGQNETIQIGYMPGIFEFYLATHPKEKIPNKKGISYYPIGVDDAKKNIKGILKYYYDLRKNQAATSVNHGMTTANAHKIQNLTNKTQNAQAIYNSIADFIQILIVSNEKDGKENQDDAIKFFLDNFSPKKMSFEKMGTDIQNGYNAFIDTVFSLVEKVEAIKIIKDYKDEILSLGEFGKLLYSKIFSQLNFLKYVVKKGDRIMYKGEGNIPTSNSYKYGTSRSNNDEEIYTGTVHLTAGKKYEVLDVKNLGTTENGAVLIRDELYPPQENWYKTGIFDVKLIKLSSDNLEENDFKIRNFIKNKIALVFESMKSGKTHYTGIFLDNNSIKKLNEFTKLMIKSGKINIPQDWTWTGDHITLNMGGPLDPSIIGTECEVKVIQYAQDNNAVAVKIVPMFDSFEIEKDIPHITIAFNEPAGARPKMSNDLKDWKPVPKSFILKGIVKEIKPE